MFIVFYNMRNKICRKYSAHKGTFNSAKAKNIMMHIILGGDEHYHVYSAL